MLVTGLGATAPLARTLALATVRRYEAMRHRRDRRLIWTAWARTEAVVTNTLAARWPTSFVGPTFCAWTDPPFCTELRRPPFWSAGEELRAGQHVLIDALSQR
jgi:hypothetical protein